MVAAVVRSGNGGASPGTGLRGIVCVVVGSVGCGGVKGAAGGVGGVGLRGTFCDAGGGLLIVERAFGTSRFVGFVEGFLTGGGLRRRRGPGGGVGGGVVEAPSGGEVVETNVGGSMGDPN